MKNSYEIREEMIAVFLKRKSGEVFETIIDCEDFEKVDLFPGTWFWKDGYAFGFSGQKYKSTEQRRTWYMHRVVNSTPEGLYVDHINFDRLDNRKINLRNVTYAENIRNRRTLSSNKSGYKGVSWNKRDCIWRVDIKIDGVLKYFGSFNQYNDAVECSKAAYSSIHPTSPESREEVMEFGEVNNLRRKRLGGMQKRNSSGHKHIFWNKRYMKWTAYMKIGEKRHTSSFSDLESAIEKVKEFEILRGDTYGNYLSVTR